MFVRLLLVVIALIALNGVYTQEADEREQRTIQLTREMVDGLLQVLSSPCKSEMEAALGSQVEISDECKYEIQSTLATMQNPGQVPLEEAQQQQTQQPEQVKKPRAKRQRSAPAANAAPTASSSPILYIIAFVVVFFSIIGAAVVYINKQKEALPAPKPAKKLSKKKEEKQRQQQSQQQATRVG